MVFLLVVAFAAVALVAGWRMAVSVWGAETPRQAVETAWYRLNPPRSVSVGALQQRILRAAVRARVVSVRGVALVPSTFEVRLHPDDLEAIAGVREWIADELGTALEERAAAEGWQLDGRPLVAFVADEARVPGRPDVRARHESRTTSLGAMPSGGPVPLPTLPIGWLRPLGDEDPIALTAATPIVLGRGSTATVDLGLPAISRRHCLLRPDGAAWTVTDLGSSNGTRVNDVRVDGPVVLQPGDVLELGGAVRFVAEQVDPATRLAPETGPMGATRVVTPPTSHPVGASGA